jgi:tetratricopeptide (TPR) repeat protein
MPVNPAVSQFHSRCRTPGWANNPAFSGVSATRASKTAPRQPGFDSSILSSLSGSYRLFFALHPKSSTTMTSLRYWAYISYSHRDEKWARWLHNAIETYRVPGQLVGKTAGENVIPKRLMPIFRDRSDLHSAHDLGVVLDKAINESEYMIVVCSPRAVQSRWVNEEILRFKRLGRESRILPIIIEGEPAAGDCFPGALLRRLDESGELSDEEIEPIAADLRPGKDGKGNAKLKIIAGMLNVRFDELKRRDLQRRYLRMVGIAALAFVMMMVTSVLGIFAVLKSQEAERRRNQSEELIGFMLGDLRDKLAEVGRLEVLDSVGDKALDYFMSLQDTDITVEALAARAKAMRQIGEIRISQGRLPEGIVAFEESLTLDRELLRANPEDTSQIFNIAQSHFWVGYARWRTGDLDSASTNFNLYLDYAKQLVRLEPANSDWQMELHYAFSNLGTLDVARGDYQDALSHLEPAADIIRNLVKQNTGDNDLQFELSGSLSWLGSANLYNGKLIGATRLFQEQVNLLNKLVEVDADNKIWQDSLADALILLGDSQRLIGDLTGEARSFAQALTLSRRLAESDPENRLWQNLEAKSEMHKGITDMATNSYASAEMHIDKSVLIVSKLVEMDPNEHIWQKHLVESLTYLSIVQQQRGNLPDALDNALQARKFFRESTDMSGADELWWKVLSARAALQLGQVYESLHKKDAAVQEWQFAYDLLYPESRHSTDVRVLDSFFVASRQLERTNEAQRAARVLLDVGYGNQLFLAKCGEFCKPGG